MVAIFSENFFRDRPYCHLFCYASRLTSAANLLYICAKLQKSELLMLDSMWNWAVYAVMGIRRYDFLNQLNDYFHYFTGWHQSIPWLSCRWRIRLSFLITEIPCLILSLLLKIINSRAILLDSFQYIFFWNIYFL